MMNVLVSLRFVGSAYHGFQIQSNALSVQSVFQNALAAVLGAAPEIKACSRTDAGVHALQFCVSFHTDGALSPQQLAAALNDHLPNDVRVFGAVAVPEGFHARYDCRGKRYLYVFDNSAVGDPFLCGRACWVRRPLDERAMDEAAGKFVGKHDFSAFSGAKVKPGDHFRTVTQANVARRGETVEFRVSADGFLYNMVRIMAGALLAVARGKLTAAQLPQLLAGGVRSDVCVTAPAAGLYLERVYYDVPEAELLWAEKTK